MTVTSFLHALQTEPELWKFALSAYTMTVLAIVTVCTALIRSSVAKAEVAAMAEILLYEQETNRQDLFRRYKLNRAMLEAEINRIGEEFSFTGKVTHRHPSVETEPA